MNPFNLFAQARAGAPLTPMQRAILKLVEGLAGVALVAALPVIAAALSSQSPNWADVAREALSAAGVAAFLALLKWAKAQGDPLLSTVADAIAQDLAASPPPLPQIQPQAQTANPAAGTITSVAVQLADGLATSLAAPTASAASSAPTSDPATDPAAASQPATDAPVAPLAPPAASPGENTAPESAI